MHGESDFGNDLLNQINFVVHNELNCGRWNERKL